MSALLQLPDAIRHNPVFTYALLAALLLALVSLGTALARWDVAVLGRPRILLRVLGAVVVSFALTVLGTALGATTAAHAVDGVARASLAWVALAYGPGVGAVAATLAAGLQTSGTLPGWHQVVAGLELTVVGWLAIYPSPRTHRWAGPLDVVLAHALAWGTGGLALLAARDRTVTPAALWAQQRPELLSVLIGAAVLATVPPAAYRRVFPHGRIAPPAETEVEPPDPAASNAGRARDPMTLSYPELPHVLARHRRQRELEPLPSAFEDDADLG